MPNQLSEVDFKFHALADPTRRAVVERLGLGSAAMSQLAKPFNMALPSFAQHLNVLEKSGLISSVKVGRVRTYSLTPRSFATLELWLTLQRNKWERRLDRLDEYLISQKEQQS